MELSWIAFFWIFNNVNICFRIAMRFLIFLDAEQFDFLFSLFFFDVPLNPILQNFVYPHIKKII